MDITTVEKLKLARISEFREWDFNSGRPSALKSATQVAKRLLNVDPLFFYRAVEAILICPPELVERITHCNSPYGLVRLIGRMAEGDFDKEWPSLVQFLQNEFDFCGPLNTTAYIIDWD